MRAFSLLIGLGLTNAVDLPQDIIGEASCDARGQDTTYPGMCECEESCCTSQAQTEEGCPVDIVIAIDMCSCNNDTWHDMKEFTRSAVNALNEQFGISDTDNSGRMAIFQFMEDVHNVVGLETFTRKEIMKKVNNMENTKFHGRGTDMTKAVKHAQSILDSSTRQGLEGIRRVFAVITNGYSDAKLTTDQDVVEAVFTMTASDDVDTVFVAREDSSVSNQRGTHTNTEVADVFERSLRLRDPVAPQQLIGDIECDALPEPDYNRQCNCKCDVPMGCHGITGDPGIDGADGPMGKQGLPGEQGSPGRQGDDGPMGEQGDRGGCGMPGRAGEKGEPGLDGDDGENGEPGPDGIKGPGGEPGPCGEKGEMGDQGEPGVQGLPGVQGEPGDSGEQGDEGAAGELDTQTLKWLVNKIFIEELNAMGLHHPMT